MVAWFFSYAIDDSGGFQLWNNAKKALRLHANGVAEIVQASNSMEPGVSITGNGRIDLTRWKDIFKPPGCCFEKHTNFAC